MKRLGAGGMGEVFLVTRDDGTQLVVKRIHPHLSQQPGFVDRFLAEARALAAINHPNVVRVLAFGEDHGAWTLSMAFVEGVELRQASGLTLAAKVRVGIELADALAAVHGAGLVHGDVNPRNVLVDAGGRAVLIDFGVAGRTGEGSGQGTLAYSAPEQLLEHALSPSTDQFSLGVVLWELLSGQRAFERESDVEVITAVTEERLLPPDVDAGLAQLVERMTEPDPGARFESLADVRDALRAEAQRLRLDVRPQPSGPARTSSSASAVVARAALSGPLQAALQLLRDGMSTEEAEAAIDGAALEGLPLGLDALEDLLAAGALRAEDRDGQRRFFRVDPC